MSLQVFEEEVLERLIPVSQEREVRYRPLVSILSEPIDVLHVDESVMRAAFKEVRGSWSSVVARPGSPYAHRLYSVRIGNIRLSNVKLFVFRDGERVGEITTDKNGNAVLSLDAKSPTSNIYTVSLLPIATPFRNPLQDVFKFTVWLVTVRVTNRTDIWWRFVGRSFQDKLPRIFWYQAPWWIIGLSAPFGTQIFIDIIPVFGDNTFTVYYGTSAQCNTPEPYPPREKCLEYRRNTWWRFEVEAYNTKTKKTASADLNVDRQLKVTFSADDISYEVIRPEGAET